MQKLKMTQPYQDFELDPVQFKKRKETIVKSVMQTLRNSDFTEEEKSRQLQQFVTELKEQRARFEYIQEQVQLSILSGAANDTHH